MGLISELLISVGADVEPFRKGMSEISTKLDETGAKSSKWGGIMAGSGLLAAGAFTGIAAFAMEAVHKTEEAGQAAYEMSEKFGLAKGTASAYLAVGQQLGLSAEQIGKGFQFLSKNVGAMQLTLDAGGKISATTGQAYKELGLEVMDSGGKVKSADTLMLEAADAFQKLEDGPMKARLAIQLFGKAGTELIPMLNEGSAGIRKMMEDGKAAGVVMGGEQVDAAHAATVAHRQLDMAVGGLSTQLGTALLPAMTAGTGFVTGHLVPALTIAGGILAVAMIPAVIGWTTAMWGAGASVIGALPGIFAWTAATWAQAVAMIAAYWPILAIIAAIGLLVGAVILIVTHWDWLKAKTLEVWTAVKGGVMSVVDSIIGKFGDLVGFVQGLPGRISSAAGGMWDGIWNAFRGMLNNIVGAWNRLHFTVGGGSFAGVSIPSMTLGVPSLPYFHGGGLVPGSGDVLAMLQGGEQVLPRGAAGGALRQQVIIIEVDQRELARAVFNSRVDMIRIQTGLRQ
jgi:hypothetical protein